MTFHVLKPSLSRKLGCMVRHPTDGQWMRAGFPHYKGPRSHRSTLLAWVVDAGFCSLPLSFVPSGPLTEVSFLVCFQTFISFHQLIKFEDFRVKTGWEIQLSIGTWRTIIKFSWQLRWSNWAPMSALGSAEFIILLLSLFHYLFWCCKIQGRG